MDSGSALIVTVVSQEKLASLDIQEWKNLYLEKAIFFQEYINFSVNCVFLHEIFYNEFRTKL